MGSREARIPVNRKSGSRRSADRRSAEAAAANAGKENDASALAERSSSERNALRPLAPSEAAQKLPDAEKLPAGEGISGLAPAETGDLLHPSAPSDADELW